MRELDKRLGNAVKFFWEMREDHDRKQGSAGGRDRGNRAKVTGGAQMNEFARLIRDLLVETGVPDGWIYHRPDRPQVTLPGWFRPIKDWDVLVLAGQDLLASIELKSQIGSLGNNSNNRAEEAIGNATDFRAAFREGVFAPASSPWLGYLVLLEDSPRSTRPVKSRSPHFRVLPEFEGASYAKRYEILCTKMVRERLYDAACLLLSDQPKGASASYREPSGELTFRRFATSLCAHASSYVKLRR